MIYHVPEFIDLHNQFGFDVFSCQAVERKNYEQVSYFFRRTLKDGGTEVIQKSAILEIMEYENWDLFFFVHKVPIYFDKDNYVSIEKTS